MKRPFEDIAEEEDVKYVITEQSDELVPPYDVSKEEYPFSPYYSQKYDDLIESTNEIVAMLEAPLMESTYQDATVDGLLAEIKQRTTSSFPEEVRIALVGDMKSGACCVSGCALIRADSSQAKALSSIPSSVSA